MDIYRDYLVFDKQTKIMKDNVRKQKDFMDRMFKEVFGYEMFPKQDAREYEDWSYQLSKSDSAYLTQKPAQEGKQ
jgi:hypothetical protein